MTRMKWSVVDTGLAAAEKNMSLDVKLLEDMSAGDAAPILHLYDWEAPSATYGYFTDPNDFLSKEASSLQLARRPTGGGIIFHITDWAFSVLLPASHPSFSMNTLDNYAFVNALVMEVVRRFSGLRANPCLLAEEPLMQGPEKHFCMAKPTRYDVMLDGRKVGGGAQRRTRHGFLHQGTISLALPSPSFLEAMLLPGTDVNAAMRRNTCALLPDDYRPQDIVEARKALSALFQQVVLGH